MCEWIWKINSINDNGYEKTKICLKTFVCSWFLNQVLADPASKSEHYSSKNSLKGDERREWKKRNEKVIHDGILRTMVV